MASVRSNPVAEGEGFPVVGPGGPGAPLLRLNGLAFRYGRRQVLTDVSFALAGGEQVVLLGPNGAGKSTLLKVCAGLRPALEGEILFNGKPLATAPQSASDIAFVAQESVASADLRAGELVLTGLAPALGAWADGGPPAHREALQALDSTGTAHLAARPLGTLSGGELRRVHLARALVRKPKLLLLDEPLAGLDLGAQGSVLDLIARCAHRGIAVIVALHDLNVARRAFARGLLLSAGRLVCDGPLDHVLSPPQVDAAFGPADNEAGFYFPRRGQP